MTIPIEYSCREGLSYIGQMHTDKATYARAIRVLRESGLAYNTDTEYLPGYFKNSDRAAVISILRLRGIEVETWGDESDKLREVEE